MQAAAQKKIAEILKTGRERAGLGLRELARRARVSPNIVCNLEAGRGKLGPITLLKLSRTLQLTDPEHASLVESAKQISARMQTSENLTSLVIRSPESLALTAEADIRSLLELEGNETAKTWDHSGQEVVIDRKDVYVFLTRGETSIRLARLWIAVAGLVPETLLTEQDLAAYLAETLAPERTEEVERFLAKAAEETRSRLDEVSTSALAMKKPGRKRKPHRTE